MNIQRALSVLHVTVLVLFLTPLVQAQSIVAGGGALYHLPIGSLGNRFLGAMGATAYVGQAVNSNWTWVGKIEYAEFSKLNTDQFIGQVSYPVGNSTRTKTFPLTPSLLFMKLTTTGIMAEAKLNILRSSILESNMNFGFGFTYWEQSRGAYTDTVVIDSSGVTVGKFAFSVVENKQTDWSGTVNVGLEADIKVFSPVSITLGADYKMIIGELWPALAMNLENVSGMQFLTVRAGVRLDL